MIKKIVKRLGIENSGNVYFDNERVTNQLVALVSLALALMSAVNLFIVFVDYSQALSIINKYILMPTGIILMIMAVIAWKFDYAKPWIKYMLLGGIMLQMAIQYCFFSYYCGYVLLVPLIISTRYFNSMLIRWTAAVTWIIFIISCTINVLFSKTEFFTFIYQYTLYNSWLRPLDALMFIVTPVTFIFTFVSHYAFGVARKGRRMLKQQTDDASRIAASEAEMEMAVKIQESALPFPNFRDPDAHFNITAEEKMAKQVGGDFFDFRMLDENRMLFLVADVSDKGLPAAMFMMSAKKAIECACLSRDTLSEIINLSNRLICSENKSNMFLTLWLGVIDVRTGIGKFANAGHMPPLLRHEDGNTELLENDPNVFLGMFPEEHINVNYFRLKEGDTLLLYTDGITDAMNKSGESFGSDALRSAFERVDTKNTNLNQQILSEIDSFVQGANRFDDMTLLSLHCDYIERAHTVDFEITADCGAMSDIIDSMNKEIILRGCPEAVRRNIDVMIDEMSADVFEPACITGGIHLNATVGSNYISLEYIYAGQRFNPLPETLDDRIGDSPLTDVGVYLVRQLADEISFEYRDGTNRLTILKIWNM